MGFEPATLRIEATNATTRPTNVDVDKQRARARVLIANANLFFPGRDRGATGRFFAVIGGVQFSLFSRGLSLHKKNLIRSSFSCVYWGMKMSRSGWLAFTNKLPQNHFEPPLESAEYPPCLIRGEY